MDSNKYIEIMHLRDLLQKEMVKTKELNEKIEALENSYITIDKKAYPKGVRFYRKPILFEIRKEDDLENIWEDYCDDLQADSEDESFAICVIGVKRQPYS
jgi:hypothetical protein